MPEMRDDNGWGLGDPGEERRRLRTERWIATAAGISLGLGAAGIVALIVLSYAGYL